MPLETQRIQALCFDLDGTLSDTDDYYAERFSPWLKRVPIVRDPERAARRLVMWIESPGTALLELSDTIGMDGPILRLIDYIYRRRKKSMQQYLLIQGVSQMLENFKGRYPMAVVSARDEDSTMAFLEQSDLLKYFDAIVSALSAPHTKPYPDPILLAAREMGVKPESCLMTGDTAVDIRAGKSAGAQTVGVLCGFGEEAELRRQGADMILKNTAELIDVLQDNHE